MSKTKLLAGVFAFVVMSGAPLIASAHLPPPPPPPDADIAWVQRERTPYGSWEEMARFFLSQIRSYDVEGRFGEPGPAINSLISINPSALEDARASDARRLAGRTLPLDGVPLVIKDNVEARGMPTTAGSLALAANQPDRDAPITARLRAAGAVLIGKSNLSEWANIRSSGSISGWSAVGGLTRNPHARDRNTCGSSSGSGAAVSAGFAIVAIGTETDGSITCPAAMNGLVGFKPTVGLVSRTGIVPISHSQDTAGPMTRTVRDAALVLNVIAGTDPADPATAQADARKTDYAAALDGASLSGVRIGVARFLTGYSTGTDAVFEANLERLRQAGAVLVEIKDGPDMDVIGSAEFTVLLTELKVDLNAYLATTDPEQVATRTLADVIAFNRATPRELALFDQDLFEAAEDTSGLSGPAYIEARETSLRLAGIEGIDRLLKDHDVAVLIAPTTGPAWTTDIVNGDNYLGSASTLPAVAGYPHLTVPMGQVGGLPVGLSFIGGQWQDARVLAVGYAYEQLGPQRIAPGFAASLNTVRAVAPLLAPVVQEP